MTLLKQALVAVLAATWLVGLYHQDTWTMMAAYIVISALMVVLIFGNRAVLRFAPRRNDRRRK